MAADWGREYFSKRLHSLFDVPDLIRVGGGLLQETVSGFDGEDTIEDSRRSS